MAHVFGAIQETITEAYKAANKYVTASWKEITCTILDEGETTEKHLLDVAAVVVDPNTGEPVEPAASVKIQEQVPLESFNESNLNDGVYTVITEDPATCIAGFNNSSENVLTITINGVSEFIGPRVPFYFAQKEFTSVIVSGTSLDFDATILGYPTE